VPPFVSIYRTCERVKRMQQAAGIQQQIEPVLGLLGVFVLSLWTLYVQLNLNKIWDAYLAAAPAIAAASGAPLPPAPPPPPPTATPATPALGTPEPPAPPALGTPEPPAPAP
jgi:hypothetical protein